MHLSLAEAATVLGKSQRQVRYLISQGRLAATKVGGRWRIESSDLPLTEAQRRTLADRVAHAKKAVEKGLAPAAKASGEEARRHFSVTDLGAFAQGRAIYLEASQLLGREQTGCRHLREALVHLSRGCHSFHPADKAARFLEAREAAATAVAELLLGIDENDQDRAGIAERIEQELIPRVTGLIAVHEKRSRRNRFERFASRLQPAS